MTELKKIVDDYMQKVSGLEEHYERCLKTERWGGSVVLMVVDASFTSIGLNYFTVVVPKVEKFNEKFVENGKIRNLKDLANEGMNELRNVWKNRRSWSIARDIASYLSTIGNDDKSALRTWAIYRERGSFHDLETLKKSCPVRILRSLAEVKGLVS